MDFALALGRTQLPIPGSSTATGQDAIVRADLGIVFQTAGEWEKSSCPNSTRSTEFFFPASSRPSCREPRNWTNPPMTTMSMSTANTGSPPFSRATDDPGFHLHKCRQECPGAAVLHPAGRRPVQRHCRGFHERAGSGRESRSRRGDASAPAGRHQIPVCREYDPGIPGRQLNILQPNGRQLRASVYMADHRLYITEATSVPGDFPALQFEQSVSIINAHGTDLDKNGALPSRQYRCRK